MQPKCTKNVYAKIKKIVKIAFITLFFLLSSCKTMQVANCPDQDGDGIPDIVDECPEVPGLKQNYGCPLLDIDGDGVEDSMDLCPEVAGLTENNGCPPQDARNFRMIGELQLPPPKATEFEVINPNAFEGISTMKEVDQILTAVLNVNDYKANKYLFVENGFALITQLEQIDKNGNAVPDENRWIEEVWTSNEFSISTFLKNLLTAQPGYYRCFVFIVTTDYYSYRPEDPTKDEIKELYEAGSLTLPFEIQERAFTNKHTVTLNVYEFIKLEHEDTIKYNVKSEIQGNHINNSKIIDELKN